MKKKGFTLVELLAVIAILAILVIMALPAVLRMYRQARQTTFIEEVQGTYKLAQTRYVQDSITSAANEFKYSNCKYTTGENAGKVITGYNELDMTTSNNFKYKITINGSTGVTEFTASNGSYKFVIKDAQKGVNFNPSDVTAEGENANVTEADDNICGNI